MDLVSDSRDVGPPRVPPHIMSPSYPLIPCFLERPKRRPGLRASLVIGALVVAATSEEQTRRVEEEKEKNLKDLVATITDLKNEVHGLKAQSAFSGVASYVASFFKTPSKQPEHPNMSDLKDQMDVLYQEVERRSAEATALRHALHEYTAQREVREVVFVPSPAPAAPAPSTLPSDDYEFHDCEEYEESSSPQSARYTSPPRTLPPERSLSAELPVYRSPAVPLCSPPAFLPPAIPVPTSLLSPNTPPPLPPPAPVPVYATLNTPPVPPPPSGLPPAVPPASRLLMAPSRSPSPASSAVLSPRAHPPAMKWCSDGQLDSSPVVHSDRSYILAFKDAGKPSHLDIYQWHGRNTTQAARLTTSLKAEELDGTVAESTWHVCQEGAEPSRLLALLMMGGQRLVTRVTHGTPCLLQLLPVGAHVKVVEVERWTSSLESDGVLLLYTTGAVHVWQGATSSAWLRTAALQEVAFGLESDAVSVENEGSESEEFLSHITAKDGFSFHKHFEVEHKKENELAGVPHMYEWCTDMWREAPLGRTASVATDYMITCSRGTFLLLSEFSGKSTFLKEASHTTALLPITIFRHAQREHCAYLFDTLGV